MNTDLCLGIVAKKDALEIAALEPGCAAVTMTFPATTMGIEAIKVFLSSRKMPVRMAVAGVAALSLALAIGNAGGRETFIVASSFTDQAMVLARYAEHTA